MVELLWYIGLGTAGAIAATAVVSRGPGRWASRGGRWRAALAASWARYRELHEQQNLLRRPWEEEFLHRSFDGKRWELHGHLPPPPGRRRSTTSSGWCPGVRDARARQRGAAG